MKGLLGMAADLFDRASNPEHGFAVNEDASLRMAELLDADPGLIDELAHLNLDQDDAGLLTPAGWIRYLGLIRSHGAPPPYALLTGLYERVQEPWFRMNLIESVVLLPDLNERIQRDGERRAERGAAYPVDEYPQRWLAGRLRAAVSAEGQDDEGYEEASQLTLILLQIGTPAAVAAARSLLSHTWRHASDLRAEVVDVLEDLPVEARGEWFGALDLPQRDDQ